MTPLRKAIKARKAIRFAQMLMTIKTALEAPCAAASKALASFLYNLFYESLIRLTVVMRASKFVDPFGTLMSSALVFDSSVSG
jgi:hypothetical protein